MDKGYEQTIQTTANKYDKTALVIRIMQIITTMRQHFTPIKYKMIVSENTTAQATSYTIWWKHKLVQLL